MLAGLASGSARTLPNAVSAGFALVAVACLMNAQLSSVWSGENFRLSQGVMAVGLAFAFNAMVGSIILEVINTGALTRPVDVLTFAGFFQKYDVLLTPVTADAIVTLLTEGALPDYAAPFSPQRAVGAAR